jgi:hypothetical protein
MARILRVAAIVATAGLAILTSEASADAIDGDWCAPDGRQLFIRGPDITTPGGIATKGNYARHSFSYVVPEGEESAGQPVGMILLNENTVAVRAAGGEPEVWVRCKPAIS